MSSRLDFTSFNSSRRSRFARALALAIPETDVSCVCGQKSIAAAGSTGSSVVNYSRQPPDGARVTRVVLKKARVGKASNRSNQRLLQPAPTTVLQQCTVTAEWLLLAVNSPLQKKNVSFCCVCSMTTVRRAQIAVASRRAERNDERPSSCHLLY